MPIDTHAHYVPPQLLQGLRSGGPRVGIQLRESPAGVAIAFDYGFATRPLFPRLIEPVAARTAWLDAQGLDRQLVATWPDMFGHGLAADPAAEWHRMLNGTLAEFRAEHAARFAWLASLPLPHVPQSVAALEWAAEHGAVGLILPANVEGVNIGELDLEPVWARAAALLLPVLLHPVLVTPAPRAAKFGLAQVAQYTFDTTLGAGSLLATGVLDRHPELTLVLSHGGGALPYLAGRFDVMYQRMDRAAAGVTAAAPPSAYLPRLAYDTIVHGSPALRCLAETAGLDRLVLGTDYSFPPADLSPIETLRAAGFDPAAIRQIADENPRRIFPRLGS